MGWFSGKGIPNKRPDAAQRMSIFMSAAEYEKDAKRGREKKAKYKKSKEEHYHRRGANVPTARNGSRSKGWFS
jgi:hypothetical protein